MNSKLECSEPITFNAYCCDKTGIQFLWDIYFEGNHISESERNKLKQNSEYPPSSDTSPNRMRGIHATLTSHMLEYLYKQCKEQAKTIELLTERMSKQDELIEEQRVNLELYINGEEVIVLKKGVFKAK